MDFKAKVLVSGELDNLLPAWVDWTDFAKGWFLFVKFSKKFSDGFGKRYILHPHTHWVRRVKAALVTEAGRLRPLIISRQIFLLITWNYEGRPWRLKLLVSCQLWNGQAREDYYTNTTLITTYFNKSSFFNNQSKQFKQIQSLFCHDGHSINWCTLKNTSKKESRKFNNCVNFRDEKLEKL